MPSEIELDALTYVKHEGDHVILVRRLGQSMVTDRIALSPAAQIKLIVFFEELVWLS